MSVLRAMQYRVGFWSEGVLGLLWSLLGIVPLGVALGHRDEVAGWGPPALLVLTGCFVGIQGVFGALLQPALLASMEHIRRGTLDYLLLMPADALFLCLVTTFSPWRLLDLAAAGLLVTAGLHASPALPSPADLGVLAVAATAGLVALYALGVLVLAASFVAVKLENLSFLLEALLDFARWPISVFRGLLRAIFTFVIPFAIMTSYPAQAILGRLDGVALAGSVATAGALAVLARTAWRRALRGYTSASS
jgi:ABC-2 type transport system permease protein